MTVTRLVIFAVGTLLLGTAVNVSAAEPCPQPAGKIVSVQGQVEVAEGGGQDWRPGQLGGPLCRGDTIRVGSRSRAALALVNDAVLRIDQNTTLRLIDIAGQATERSWLELVKGAIQSFSRKPRLLTVNTPYLNGSIEGTEFVFRVEGEESRLTVFEGTVVAANEQGSVPVPGGSSVTAAKGQAPQPRIVVKPRDEVQWALYYPPVLAAGAPSETLQAAELLQVGRVDEAKALIEGALGRRPEQADALALQAVIAVVHNDPALARASAERSVRAAPNSASAFIALSYAQQASFDLPGARASLQRAVKLEPNNALAWARLAELDASFAELNEALDAAQRAASLAPDLSRTQTVLGFSYLMQVRTADAKAAFDKAIAQDQADPLPRLGKGLARIREGALPEGRQEIEIAAGLDANNSLIRSYLGKAYYEEKRHELTEKQYEVAKKLDPNDPTPHFYDAIEKETTNRPVEALQEMQESIELNDNRAVYRSRLLLDSDLAARSAALGRVYGDLGFQQLALVEGWKSVNTDPSNFSAHRLLADSYSVVARHEIARVSELLQSQLLQPLNFTPIQPRLAESNLFLINSAGPAGLSFNEFNPLFNRDGVQFQGSALTGDNGTNGEEAVLSGIREKLSYSVGYSHFETDGWRKNAGQNDDIATAFIQMEVSADTSIQAEYRYRKTRYGDLLLRFFPDEFFPGQANDVETHTMRVGGRHDFSPGSTILVNAFYQHSDTSFEDPQFPVTGLGVIGFGVRVPENGYGVEAQHLYRSPEFRLTSGTGHFGLYGDIKTSLGIPLPPPPDGPGGSVELTDKTHNRMRHFNAYSYGTVNVMPSLDMTIGMEVDSVSGDFPGEDTTKYNPKFGIVWNPVPATTIRAAGFKTLKRTLIANQTLEPTQVAGFNQFFDDIDLTEATVYGAAIDQKFSREIFGGIGISKRDLKIPFISVSAETGDSAIRQADADERLGRAYLFWTPHPWWAFKLEYSYEHSSSDEQLQFGYTKLDTQQVGIGAGFFHPSGFGASLRTSYVDQDGDFTGVTGDNFRSGSDKFWLVDAALNYRLPARRGFVTVGASNLFDQDFKYFDVDFNNARIQPARMMFLRLTLAIP